MLVLRKYLFDSQNRTGVNISQNEEDQNGCVFDCTTCKTSLSKVYYILKSLKGVINLHIIKTIYFAYFQTRTKYGIALWFLVCKRRKSSDLSLELRNVNHV
jgi:hypothetical protein